MSKATEVTFGSLEKVLLITDFRTNEGLLGEGRVLFGNLVWDLYLCLKAPPFFVRSVEG